jgi:molecular chaperone HscC
MSFEMSGIIGIDLGTTNSLASCFQDGKCTLIPNAFGETLTPSAVSVLDNGEIVVGRAAKERLYTHPERTAGAFKRFMGTNKSYSLGNNSFTPVMLSSLVIQSLVADAKVFLGEAPEEAVISVPAYFNDQQRRATKQAGELAGLRVERLVSEPTAAALAYGLHEGDGELKFLVFDLGGGTFDVSIVDIFENILEVKAVAGNNYLGGEDFDKVIADYFIEQQNLATPLTPKAMAVIKEKAEVCKRALSLTNATNMQVTLDDKQFSVPLTSRILENISEPILSQLKKPVLRALRDSRLEPRELDHVILVGGATRMPVVRAYVAKLFGRLPMNWLNPDEVVGLGAGVCAGMKARNEALSERYMTDICPYTLGTEVLMTDEFGNESSGHFLPIIERNATIPCSKAITVYTVHDRQKAVSINVYQGESRLVANNLKLGEFSLPVPPKPAGEAGIEIRYTYDINGILEVEATSLDTRETKRVVILHSETHMSEKEVDACLKRLAHLKIHPREESRNRFLLEKGERLYEEALAELRREIDRALQRFETILDRQDPIEIEKAAREMEEFLNGVESNLY